MADLILFLPVADHRADELFLEKLQGASGFESPWMNLAADVAFFTAHILYYSALKSVFQYFLWLDRNKGSTEEEEEKEEPLKPLIEVMGKVISHDNFVEIFAKNPPPFRKGPFPAAK